MSSQCKGYVIEHDSSLSKIGRGPHQGAGQATAIVFFREVDGFPISFQKHVLHLGAEVGYHKQTRDEIYYIISGVGIMVVNTDTFEVKPGNAILTYKKNYHGMRQIGNEDLVFIVTYPKQ